MAGRVVCTRLKPYCMNKKVIALIVGLFVFALLVTTCPDRQAHQDTLKAVVASCVENSVAERTQDSSGVFGLIGSVLSGPFIDAFLDAKLQVHNYLVVSVGQITLGDTTKTVSVGLLNHVFTCSTADIDQAMDSDR